MVDPAARRPGRGGQHVDERRHVVVGDLLALGDRLRRVNVAARIASSSSAVGPSISSQAATSTSRIASKRAWSDQISASSGRV